MNNSSGSLNVGVMRTFISVDGEQPSTGGITSPSNNIVMAGYSNSDLGDRSNFPSSSDIQRNSVAAKNFGALITQRQTSAPTLPRLPDMSNRSSIRRGSLLPKRDYTASFCSRAATISGRLERNASLYSRMLNPFSSFYTAQDSSFSSTNISAVSSISAKISCRQEVLELSFDNKDLGVDVQDGMVLNMGNHLVILNLALNKCLGRYVNFRIFSNKEVGVGCRMSFFFLYMKYLALTETVYISILLKGNNTKK